MCCSGKTLSVTTVPNARYSSILFEYLLSAGVEKQEQNHTAQDRRYMKTTTYLLFEPTLVYQQYSNLTFISRRYLFC